MHVFVQIRVKIALRSELNQNRIRPFREMKSYTYFKCFLKYLVSHNFELAFKCYY